MEANLSYTPEEIGRIYAVSNGWVLCFYHPETGNPVSIAYAYDTDDNKPQTIVDMLFDIQENCCGFYNSKHSPYRITIEVKKK